MSFSPEQWDADTSNARESNASRRLQSTSIVTPLNYVSQYAYPLIVWVHSDGHNEHQIRDVLPHISQQNYVGVGVRGVRAVDVRGGRFEWPQTRSGVQGAIDAVADAIDAACQHANINSQRIVLAGYRSGATMACRVALAQPERFAGVVRMGGNFPKRGGLLRHWQELRQRKIPMLWQQAINQIDDDPVKLTRDLAVAQWIQSPTEVRQYRGDDVMNTVALDDINSWIFRAVFQPHSPDGKLVLKSEVDETLQAVEFSLN